MAVKYVDYSKTEGGDTGADWTNAWLSIDSALTVMKDRKSVV